MPKSSRPSDITSSIAACSASSTGWCQGSTITALPSRSVLVRIARQVSNVSVAEIWFQPEKWCSTRKLEQ